MTIDDIRAALRSRAALVLGGMSDRDIAHRVRSGDLVRVDHTWYIAGAQWNAAWREERHRIRVVAATLRARSEHAVVGLVSAATLHGLPLWNVEPRRVHLLDAASDGMTTSMVARHAVEVADEDVVVIEGIRATSLAKTVADVIRAVPVEAGLAVADAALRSVAGRADGFGAWDDAAAEGLRADIAARLPVGGRGVRRARLVVGFADARAESAGESVSRLRLAECGFRDVELQVRVPGPRGWDYAVDFDLRDPGAGVWGEYDGVGKYLDPALRTSADAIAAVLQEKSREDWIRGTTGRRMVRWGTPHIRSAADLGRRLANFGVRPPSGPVGLRVVLASTAPRRVSFI